jgi:8-oxo-dGTP pyrophosphatase MutT (NUDIX family)
MVSDFKFDRLKPDPAAWDPVYFSVARKPSAVAVIVFVADRARPKMLLIRRSTRLSSHKGQIGFPGGRLEAGDSSPRDTALRETYEEVGLDPSAVKVIGSVDPVPALDGSLVYPVVATTEVLAEDLNANPAEVSEIFMVPTDYFVSGNRRKFRFNLFGCWRHSFLYECGSVSVWGLSAEILAKVDLNPG